MEFTWLHQVLAYWQIPKGFISRTETTRSGSLNAKNDHNVLITAAEYMICLLYIARSHVLSHLVLPPHKSEAAV